MKSTLLIVVIFSWSFPTIFSQKGENDASLKKKQRIEKRYIHPKSKYLSISGGWGFTSTHVKGPSGFLNQGLIMQNNTYLPNIMYEHGLKSYFFAEIGYSYIGQGISNKRMVDGVGGGSYSKFYSNHDVQLGIGYRVINKNNYHFLNAHAGLFVGFANEQLENLPMTSNHTRIDHTTNSEYLLTRSITNFHPVSFGPYLGVSKELRLSKDVRFFVKYVQRFGLNATMSGTFELSSDEIDFDNDISSFKVRGGGAFITGGLKILLFKKKLEDYED